MKYKSIASPKPSEGYRTKGKKLVVPNQSMSLLEILQRFTRNEPLPVGHEIHYHESVDDLEKIQHMDLVDRQEFIDRLKQTQKDFEKQEKMNAEKAKKEAIEKAKAELKAEFEKQQKPPEKGAIAE